jgi:hypothetical protein
MSLEYYHRLNTFSNFNEFHSPLHYKSVPPGWNLLITDVKGSTDSIQKGRYRDVNTLGVASIVVVRRALNKQEFPFVFGGDGATLLLPADETKKVIPYLLGLKKLALQTFGMELRVGLVSIDELNQLGYHIEMGRFFLSTGFSQAMIRGSGITKGEKLIKENYAKYSAKSDLEIEPDLTGLTCRWKPIPSKRGEILTLLIRPQREEDTIYSEILEKFQEIFPEGLDVLNPALDDQNTYRPIWESIQNESRFQSSLLTWKFIYRVIAHIPSWVLFYFRVPIPMLINYIRSTASHSDYRKFDDMLRMVLDCSSKQALQVKTLLKDLHAKNQIYYGTNLSQKSIMTCYVEGMKEGEHIHFLDAENGGYTAAAMQMKAQMNLSF